MTTKRTFLDKCFKDSSGNFALFQQPNLLIIIWFIAMILTKVSPYATKAHQLFDVIAFGTLFAWAWLELFKGASYFRRGLGLLVLVLLIVSRSGFFAI